MNLLAVALVQGNLVWAMEWRPTEPSCVIRGRHRDYHTHHASIGVSGML